MSAPRLSPIALSLALATLASAQDPFAPSERWRAVPGVDDWSPDQVVFAGDDAFLWGALDGDRDALHVYDVVQEGVGAPRAVVPPAAGQFGAPLVAAGSRGDAVFALRQIEAPDVYRRAPLVSAFDPRTGADGATVPSTWTHDMVVRINGPARLATDARGDLVVAAVWDDRNARVRVDLLDGTNGDLRGSAELPAIGLGALAVSADGSRVAVAAGMTLYLLDGTAQVVGTAALDVATQALALSADGGTIAHGLFGGVQILADFPGVGLFPFTTIPGDASEIPSRLDLSADGGTLAVGWWQYTTGVGARLQIVDVFSQFPLAELSLPAAVGASQNLVSSVRITPDGTRAAFGTWGNGSAAEAYLLGVGAFAPILTVDTPGSVRGLDLDASGTRVAVGHRATHASVFGARGGIRLVDSGERSVQLLETPAVGGELLLAAKRTGAGLGWFLVGPRSETPQPIAGVTGALLLQRGRVLIHPVPPRPDGRIDLALPIAPSPLLRGTQLHVQAAFRLPGILELSRNLVSPFLLD